MLSDQMDPIQMVKRGGCVTIQKMYWLFYSNSSDGVTLTAYSFKVPSDWLLIAYTHDEYVQSKLFIALISVWTF